MVKVPVAIPSLPASFLYGAPAGGGSHLRSLVVAMHILIGKYLTPYLLGVAVFLLFTLRSGRSGADDLALRIPRLPRLFFGLAVINLPLTARSALNAFVPSVNTDTSFAWFFLLGVLAMMAESPALFTPAACPGIIRVAGAVFTALALASRPERRRADAEISRAIWPM